MPNNIQKPANRSELRAVSAHPGLAPASPASVPAQSREAELAPPQVVSKGRIAFFVNPVSLYASLAQVVPHHKLPHGNFPVRNDTFSCIPVRLASAASQVPKPSWQAAQRAFPRSDVHFLFARRPQSAVRVRWQSCINTSRFFISYSSSLPLRSLQPRPHDADPPARVRLQIATAQEHGLLGRAAV
jgi:hypothetical protein